MFDERRRILRTGCVVVALTVLGLTPAHVRANDNPALGIGEPTTPPDDPCKGAKGLLSWDCIKCKIFICRCGGTSSPVFVSTGASTLDFTDLAYALSEPRHFDLVGTRLQFGIQRAYHSDDFYVGYFGKGFSSSLEMMSIPTFKGQLTDEVVVIHWPDGRRNPFNKQPDGTYTPSFGVTEELVETLGGFELTDQAGTVYTFDDQTRLLSIADSTGNDVSFGYDVDGRPDTVTLFNNRQINITYNASGYIDTISDFAGRTVSYAYDTAGHLTSFTDPEDKVTTYTYQDDLLASIISPVGEVTFSATYDADGRVIAFTNREGNYTYTYGANSTTKHDVELNVDWRFDYDVEGLITRIVRPDGVTINNGYDPSGYPTSQGEGTGSMTVIYDSENRVAQTTDPAGATTTYTYVPDTHLLETETNHFGVVTRYDYDADGLLTRQRDAFGTAEEISQSWTYDPDGTLASYTDHRGNTVSYFYDANHLLTRMVNREAEEWLFQYDSIGNLLTEEDPLGNQKTTTYDKRSLPLVETDDLLRDILHEYDDAGRQTRLVDRRNNESLFEYNEYDFITAVIGPEPSVGAPRPRSEFFYDSHNLLTRMIDTNSNAELILNYNAVGQLTQRVQPSLAGTLTTDITVNAQGFETSMADPREGTRTYQYDGMNRLTQISRDLGEGIVETETFAYDAIGRLTQKAEANGRVTTYTYDSLDRRTAATDQFGTVYTAQFDPNGNETQMTMGALEINATWDNEDRLKTATDGTGRTMNYFYDGRGLLTRTGTAGARDFDYQYDEFGNLTLTSISLNAESFDGYAFQYDANHNLTRRTDPLNNQTEYEYDALNRLTVRRTAVGTAEEEVESFEYDPAGNLTSRTLADAASVSYAYDDRNRVTSIDYPGADQDIAYTYDANGRLASATNPNSTTTFVYELFGARVRQTTDGKLLTVVRNEPAGTVSMTYPSGRTVVRSYDTRRRLTSVEVNAAEVASFTYDDADRVLTKSYANATQATYGWDARGLPLSVEHDSGGTPFWSRTYSHDDDSLSEYERDELDANNSSTYSFDGASRLTEHRVGVLDGQNEIPVAVSSTGYAYDDLGSLTRRVDDGVPSDRGFNAQDEATTVEGTAYTYDGRGNVIDDGANTYGYDLENRLTRITRQSDSTDILLVKYDALGNRVETTEEGGVVTRHIWSASTVIEERDAVDAVVREFVHRDEAPGSPLVMYNGATPHYYHEDGRRNIVALSDSGGSPAEQYDYTPYGRTGGPSALGNPFRWGGHRQDPNGWSHLKYRSYDPNLGRFAQRDPRSTPMTPGQLPGLTRFDPPNLVPGVPGLTESRTVAFEPVASQRYSPRNSIDQRDVDRSGIQDVLAMRNSTNVNGMDAIGYQYYGLQTPDRASRYGYGGGDPLDHWDAEGEFWNPISGGVSGCVLSGCVLSGCWGSRCLGSACGNSGCLGSACGKSACFGSACRGSVCGGSGCSGSACLGSACKGSLCWGSTCVGSLCAGSACIGSMCGGSGCISSKCGGSACILSICGYASRCALSVCYKSACFLSICASSKCVQSACIKGSCKCSREVWGQEPTEALAALDVEDLPGGGVRLSIASSVRQELAFESGKRYTLEPHRLHVFTVASQRGFDLSIPSLGVHPQRTSFVEFAELVPAEGGSSTESLALADLPGLTGRQGDS